MTNAKLKNFVDAVASNLQKTEISKQEVIAASKSLGLPIPGVFWTQQRVSRGVYTLNLTTAATDSPAVSTEVSTPVETSVAAPESAPVVGSVPAKDPNFVKWGNYSAVDKIIKSKSFATVFITGDSGNGKTHQIEQSCANNKREMIRVNCTIQTDEDDLIGHYGLQDGNTVWHDGPVVVAAERGAVLLLDEVDLIGPRALALQPVLEGKPFYIKKTNRWVTPKEGFAVFATANTKGKGSEDGRYIGTNILNEAFLDRFMITIEQKYPSPAVENRILLGYTDDIEFVNNLTTWADIIRRSYYDGAVDEIIATRRLIHIVRTYNIFGKKEDSLNFGLNRFDDQVKQAFLDLWSNVSEDAPEESSAEGDVE